jgi:macrolide transport system ATP-binding/permease protein
MTPPLITLHNIHRHYATGDAVVRALDGVSLTIHAGEFVAIMGQSGSGKSTMMNILGCLDRATDGTYEIAGRNVATLDNDGLAALRRETFGFVFQRYNLLPTSTALENVEIPALYAGMPRADRTKRADELLQKLGLGDRAHHRPTELSGGQQQRVAIARALMNNPPVILADEPTGALDSRSGDEVMALLKQLNAEGRTIILITHDEKVARQAQRIIRMKDGKITGEDGKITTHPAAILPASTPTAPAGQAAEAVTTALKALRVNKFRTALTLLGIVIGVSAVITMLAVGNGSKQAVLDQITRLGTNIMNVRPGAPGVRNSGDNATLLLSDAAALESLDNITVVVPERAGRKTVRYLNTDYATSVTGVGAGFPLARDWPVAMGTFFALTDIESYAPVAVLGKTVADKFFAPGDNPVGQYILVGNIPFEIIGVLSAKGAAPWGGDQDDVVYVPHTTAITRLYGQSHLSSITIKVTDATRVDETESAIIQTLKDRHGAEDFSVRNSTSFLETATQTQNVLTILLGAVAAISLLVGGIGVMNIMLVSVTERRREIGIRMAAGARMRDILFQFNTESAVVCTIGGVVGVVLGFSTGYIVSLFDVDIAFSAAPALLAFASAVATGILFGYLPARKAARLDPVIALSSE